MFTHFVTKSLFYDEGKMIDSLRKAIEQNEGTENKSASSVYGHKLPRPSRKAGGHSAPIFVNKWQLCYIICKNDKAPLSGKSMNGMTKAGFDGIRWDNFRASAEPTGASSTSQMMT